MRLATIEEFRKQCFVGKAPCKRTILKEISQGKIPGRYIGNTMYIDLDEWGGTTGNKLADKILQRAA